MSIRGFVLGVALLAVVGWCMVVENITETRTRYQLAELGRREQEVKKRLDQLHAHEETLRSPQRLAGLKDDLRLRLVWLGTVRPHLLEPARDFAGTGRKPGQVLDRTYGRAPEPVNLAGAAYR